MKNILLVNIIILTLTSFASVQSDLSKKDWPENCYMIWALKSDTPHQSAAVSHTDWFIWQRGAWGKPGVRYIINKCAAAGIRTLWWRTHSGGLANYPTEIPEATYFNCPYRGMSYEDWDSLSFAIDYAHELGMEIYAWFTPFEETHGWADSVRSKYMDIHPEYSDINKLGNEVGIPSFFFEEYRNYKTEIVRELLTRWNFDGLVLDFERLGAPKRSENWGYIPEIMATFEDETGLNAFGISEKDVKWMDFRSSFVGTFVNNIAQLKNSIERPFELVFMGVEGQEHTSHVNLNQWLDKCDTIAMGNYSKEPKETQYGWIGNPESAFSNIESNSISKTFIAYSYYGDGARLMEAVENAKMQGSDICWFESTPLNYRNMFWVPAKLGLEKNVRLVKTISKTLIESKSIVSMSFKVLGRCKWDLSINGNIVAHGDIGRESFLGSFKIDKDKDTVIAFATQGPFGGSCGLSAVVYLIDENGLSTTVVTDASWQAVLQDNKRVSSTLMGKPGAAPFIPKDERE